MLHKTLQICVKKTIKMDVCILILLHGYKAKLLDDFLEDYFNHLFGHIKC
jgi:hypothetical protein